MKKYFLAFVATLLFVFACTNTNVLASRNDDRNDRDHQQTPKPTKTPTPTPTPRPTSHDESRNDNRHDNHDRHDRDHDEDCDDPQDPTATPTVRPSVTPTATPSATPTATSNNPTQTPIATPNLDVCPNLDGVQTSLPDEYHFDTVHYNCLKFELGGPSQSSGIGGANVLGASTVSTGQVLGASTMAGTGSLEETFFYSLFSIGSLLTSVGIMKNVKKKSK